MMNAECRTKMPRLFVLHSAFIVLHFLRGPIIHEAIKPDPTSLPLLMVRPRCVRCYRETVEVLYGIR
jgi:hypothetical protein